MGHRTNGKRINTEVIQLNDSIDENVWHRMSLTIDKDSKANVKLFFDEKLVGRLTEYLPPRDVGGVMIVNNPKNGEKKALFKNFVVGRCIRFNSYGECKYQLVNSRDCP